MNGGKSTARRLGRRALVFVGVLSIVVTTLPIRNVVPALAAGYSSTILADSPAAYWRLGDLTGTSAADATSHSNTGTYTGGFTLGQPGALFGDSDTAVKLDGTSGYVSVPNSATLQSNQVSIELWIKKVTETPWGTYVSKNIAYGGAAGSSWFQLLNYGTTGRLQFRVTGDDSQSSLQSSSTLSLNTWYYVVATYDGTTAKLYVNGSLDSTLAITATPTQTTDPLNIGRRPDGYYNNAVLDEVAIYSSALSATQVGNHWTASANPPGAPTAVTASKTTNQATVTWVDPASQGASTITGYTVTPKSGSSIRTPVTVSGPTATTATLTGLSAGAYTFTVVANNANGSSVPSAASGSVTVTGSTYGYSSTVLADAPAVYWRLGEASGTTAYDATAQGDNGTYFGTRSQNQVGGIFGDPDHAVTFDGSTGYVIAPSTAALKGATVSIELSLKKVSESANGTYISKNFSPGGGAGTGWFELMNQGTTGRLQFRVTGDTADVSLTSNRVLALNTWYDVVATYDGTTANLYINGALDNSMPLTAAPAISSDPLYIGRRPDGNYTNAVIDEVAIYPTALTAAKITTHWQAAGYVPGVPTGATATLPHNTTNQASVSWTAPSATGASAITGYTVTPQGGPVQRAAVNAAASPVTITGLSGGSAYTFTVVANNGYGSGPASSPSASKTPTGNAVPTVPTSVTATPGNTQAVVNWGVPTSNGGSAITSYTVTPYIGSAPGTPKPVTGSPPPTNTTMTGLANGTQYTFKVYASNAVGPGPAASTTATTPATVPGAPTGVGATAGNAQARVSWSAPSNGGSAITGYTVTPYVGTTAQTATGVNGSTTATTITNLANGTPYTFQVTATNTIGTSAAGSSGAAITPAGPGPSVPGPPASIVASPANGAVPVQWVAPNNGGSGITSYTLTPYVGTTAGTPVTIVGSPPATNATITGLTNGITYVIYVAASNTVGTGPAGTSNPVTPAAVPGAPTAVTAVGGNAQATVSWTAPASNGGTTIQSYTVTPSIGSSVTVSGGVTSVVISGLTNGTSYSFTITANNSAGSSPVGTSNVVTPATVPDPPGAVSATSGNATATLAWSTPATNGSTITMYTVTPYIGSTAGTPTTVTAPATGTTITSLINGTTYTFQITATNAVGTGIAGVSNPVTVGTPTPPATVTASSSTGNQALVTWTASSGGASAVTGYVVTAYLGLQAENSVGAPPAATSVTISGLKSGTYTFQVTPLNASGTGLASFASGSVAVAGSTATYASTVQGDGAVAYYRLGEANGSPIGADSSGIGRTASYSGTLTSGGAGALPNDPDTATSFSAGSLQLVGASGMPINNAPRTFEAWINTTSAAAMGIVGYGTANSQRALFSLRLVNGNQLNLVAWQDDRTFTAPYPIANGNWHQVVVTYGSTTLTMYLDGQSLGTTSFSAPLNTVVDGNGLLIGRDIWVNCCNWFSGSIDEVAVYPYALSAVQVVAHFNASGNLQPTAPTITAVNAATANQATVAWSASTASVGAPITGYVLTAYAGTAPQNSVAVAGNVTSATLTGLASASYTFKVMAVNNFGNGPLSPASSLSTITGMSSTYASTVLSDNPIDYYRFSETGGTIGADSSGGGHHGSYYGTYTLGSGGALLNDTDPGFAPTAGALTHVLGNGLPLANAPRTMEAWIKTTSGASQGIVGYGAANSQRALFSLQLVNGNQLNLVAWQDNKTFTAPYTIANGGWHQVAVTYDATTLTMYLDGQSLGTTTFSAPLNTFLDTNGLLIGRDIWVNCCNWFSGSIDEVAVYGKALTATQIANHFLASGNTRPTVPSAVTASSGSANQASVSWTASTASAGAPVSTYVVTAVNGSTAQNAIAVSGTVTSASLSGLGGGTYSFQVQAFNNFGASPVGASGNVVVSGSSTYASTVLGDNPIDYYRFSETGGTIGADSSGGGHHGSYYGTYTLGGGGALLNDTNPGFSPTAGALTYALGNGLPLANAPRTMEAWIKTTSGASQGIVGYGAANFQRALFSLQLVNGNQLSLVAWQDNKTFTAPYTIANGGWHQVAVTYDATTLTMYLDGQSLGTTTFAAPLGTFLDTNGLLIGRDIWVNCCNWFSGSIDEVAVYGKALTATQIANHFAASGNSRPSAPASVSASSTGTNQATVSWVAPSGSPSSYLVTAFNSGVRQNTMGVSGTVTSATFTGLKGGATYSFQVQAFNNFGAGPTSATSNSVVPAGGSTYASTVLADGPAAYFRLDDLAGSVTGETSGNSSNGTYAGGYTLGQSGALASDVDAATKFDGVSGSVTVPSSSALQNTKQVTIELWLKKVTDIQDRMYVTKNFAYCGGAGTSWYQLMNNGGHIEFRVTGDCGTAMNSSAALAVNTWYYVVATYDGKTAKLYINGSLDSSYAITATPTITNDPIYIGRRSDGYYNNAVIDDVAIYPVALTDTQIGAHYTASGNAALPASPGGVSAAGGTGQATVSWNTPSGNGGTIASYTVTPYIGTTAGTPVQVPAPANSTIVTGLANGTTYTFQVTATSNIGTGQPSISNAVTVGAPGTPTGITATGGNAQAAVSWTAPPSNASGITSYSVTPFVGSTAGSPTTVTGAPPPTSTNVTGLVNGTTYTFQVTATNSQGTSPAGTSGAATLGLPSAPGSVGATIPGVNNQAQVTWAAASANGLSITGYLVTAYNGAQGVGAQELGSTATAATITGLSGGTGYTFNVVATTSAGNGPAGTSGLVTPTGPTSTYASTVVSDGPAIYYRLGDPSGNAAADSSGNGSNGVYNGSYALGGPSALTNDTDTSLSLTNGNVQLVAGTGLPSGSSPRTIEAWIKTTNTNYQVVAAYGTANNFHHYLEVRVGGSNIQIITSSDDPVITGPYSLADGTWHHLVVAYDGNTTATVYVDGKIAGTAQFSGVLITAADANGLLIGQDSWCNCSDQFVGNLDEVAIYPYALSTAQVSTHASASGTVPPSPPTAPTAVTAVAGANQASLSWTAPAGTITKYLVAAYQGSQAQNTVGLNGTTTSVVVSGLQAGLPYTFNVLAYNAYGASPPGTSASVTPTGTNPMYAPSVLADTPLEYYRLDDPSGTVGADSSGNSRSATYGGAYTQASAGALPNDPDKALYVNGATVTASDSALAMGNGARTIEAWVNTTGGGVQAIAGYGTAATRSLFDLRLNGSNQVGVVTWADDKYFTAPYSLTNGQWHQVAATYDGTTVVVYVDGQSIGQSTFGSGLGTQSNGGGFVVGRDSWACCDSFVGTLDDVSVYGSALSSSRILAHFSASGNSRPAAPTGMTATAGAGQATITWTVPPGTIGWNMVTATQGTQKNQQAVAGGATNSTVISGLTPGLSYTFTVTATNNFGSGPTSAPSAAIVPTGSGTPYAGTVLADSPLEYYRLGDSGTTVAADSSGNAQLGTYSGSTYTLGATGGLTNDADRAVTLNNGGQVTAPDGPLPMGNSARTIEAWVNTSTTTGTHGVAGYGTNATRGLFNVRINGSNQVGVVGGYDDHYFNVPYSVTNGQWHQVVATYDGATLIMYVDGQQVGQTTTFAGALGTQSNGSGLVIGRDSWCVCDLFNGTMDEVSIYGSALSPARVLAHFTASGNARLAAPTGVAAVAGANQATVSWTAPAGSVTGYQVTAISGNVAQNSMMVGVVTTATISGLNVGSAYTFQVQALNNFGSSPVATSPLTTITAGSNPAYAATVLGDGPVAYYRLDDSAGTAAADSSGGGQTGGYSGTYTLAQAGGLLNDSDKSVYLNAVNGGSVTAPDAFMPMGNNRRTIEAWFNTSASGTQGLAGYGASGTRTLFNLRLSGTNQIGVVTSNDDHYFTAGYPLTNGIWHQVAATYDGTTLVVYVDGQSIGQTTFAGSLGTQSNGSGLVIGRDSWATTDWLTGNVDDVSVYAKTLTSSQIANHWAAAGYRRPGTSLNPIASSGPQGAVVSWSPPSDLGNPPLTGYTVTPFAGTTAGTPVSVGPNLTNVTITGLVAGTSYSYQIKANSVYDPPPATTAAVTSALALVPVPANSAYVLEVAYPDTSHPFQNFLPSPWNGAPNTTFIGTTGPIEGGAIRIHDLTGSGLTVNDITADVGTYHFANIWGSNLAVPAGGDLILASTISGAGSNFDSSDTPPGNCLQSGLIPLIHVTINGVHIDWKDSGQILNTGGIDSGSGGCGIGEGHDWSIIHNGPLPSEVMGPNGSMKICWTCMGLPVNTDSGDFWHSFTDFNIPGRGFNLHFDRTYNSQMGPYDGPLGYGWSDPYNMFLSYDTSSGTILVHQEAGSSVVFTANGSTYTPSTGVLASLVRNADGTFTFQRTDLAKYVFNARGELLSETDRNGYATTFSYTSDQLTTITEPAGRTLTLTYTGTHITKITDNAGNRNVTFAYDSVGNLTKATDVGGASWTFTYDITHLMLTMTDRNGGTVTNVYDSSGRVTKQTDAMGRITLFSYTPGQTTITDPNGNQTQDIYENGELIQETKAFGTLQAAKWLYSYDQFSLGVASVKDPNGNLVTNTWDANGNLLTNTDALNRIASYTYNGFNEVLTETDPLNVRTANTYDGNGNLTQTSTPVVGTTQYSTMIFGYDPTHPGDLTSITDRDGKVWTYGNDSYGMRNKAVDPLGATTTYTYDNVGRLQSMVTAKGNVLGGNPGAYTTTYSFNAYGDRLSATDPVGDVATYRYDASRNLVALIDGNAHQTSFAYDPDNELVQIVRADGSTLKTGYDADGNVTSQSDGLGNSTTYQYNALTQLSQRSDQLNRVTTYSHDGVGNLLTIQNPKDSGVSYTMGYDVANQLKTITYSDGQTPNVSLSYDNDGQRQQMVDGTGTTSYTFDSLHRLTQSTNGAGAQVQYSYDLAGNLTRIVYPGGANAVNRAYDGAGRLTSITDWLNDTTKFAYDPNSNLTTQTYPNGVVASLTYDAADRLMQIVDAAAGGQLLNLSYSRDSSNQLTTENATTYTYDQTNRVTGVVTGSTVVSYGYDAADNLLKIVNGGATTTQIFDAANQLQSSTTLVGSTQTQKYTYAYDPNGNRTSRTDQNNVATAYSWDQENHLNGYGTTASYQYDGDGLRASKTVSGTPSSYVWDRAESQPLLIKDGSIAYVTGPGGLPVEQINGTAVSYYHQDQLGSTRLLTNAAGSVVAAYAFDALGNLTSTPPNVTNPFQFAGQYLDSESGLYYLRARYYDPTTGQFLSRDPLVSLTREPYAYVGGNLLNLTDPLGLGGGGDDNPASEPAPEFPGEPDIEADAQMKQDVGEGRNAASRIAEENAQGSDAAAYNAGVQAECQAEINAQAETRAANAQGDEAGTENLGSARGTKWVNYLIRKYGLSPDQARDLHDAITGQNYNRQTIEQIAQDMTHGR